MSGPFDRTQLIAIAETETFRSSAIVRIAATRGSIVSIGMLENLFQSRSGTDDQRREDGGTGRGYGKEGWGGHTDGRTGVGSLRCTCLRDDLARGASLPPRRVKRY